MNNTIGLFDKRPPYVRFEEREMGIDADASEVAGRPVPRTVVLACITSAGSKDTHDAIAEEWLESIRKRALRGEYPLDWSQHFRASFEEWKKGNELPRTGTPVKTWAMVSREQANRLHAVGHTTVEDLAQVPDTALGQIGLDGRYLRDLARGWIQEAKDKGVNTRALADANVRIDDLEKSNAELRKRLGAIEAQQQQPVKRGPGRPPKVVAGSLEDET